MIESLQEYLLISQDKPKVEQYFLQKDGTWGYRLMTGLVEKNKLPSIDCELLLAEVYLKVDFESDEQSE